MIGQHTVTKTVMDFVGRQKNSRLENRAVRVHYR